jgi:ferrochelatase
MNKALLLVNMGGPSHLNEIENYLRAIFNDPAILPVPGFMRKRLASFIVSRRKQRIVSRYSQIGGASPLPSWTVKLCKAVEKVLQDSGKSIKVAHAFRYSSPTINEAISSLSQNEIGEVYLLPLFPHRTNAMTGSIEKETARVCDYLNIKLRCLPAWGNRNEVLSIWSQYLRDALDGHDRRARVLFVAHGIPIRDVKRGDDYPERVAETAQALGQSLGDIEWSLAYQSRVGPVRWTQPYLDTEVPRLATGGTELVLMPLSFVADCLETLYDLDIVAAEKARNAGARLICRVRVFNDDIRFARAMAQLALEGGL